MTNSELIERLTPEHFKNGKSFDKEAFASLIKAYQKKENNMWIIYAITIVFVAIGIYTTVLIQIQSNSDFLAILNFFIFIVLCLIVFLYPWGKLETNIILACNKLGITKDDLIYVLKQMREEICDMDPDEEHKYAPVNGKCMEECTLCFASRIIEHKWEGNKCIHCGETRDVITSSEVKTYSNPDYSTHVEMAVNDLCGICGSAVLSRNIEKDRQWIRNVGQDLYNTHGFRAMQDVFIQVKNRYPMFQSALSQFWDGVGGWVD